ncbi:hypothetical protein NLJ89_g6540 [Agrocybe chaxingu]|uniref:Uncharacterized protein n=1 Tax=Agrocybe chaxingu TaxID=84603 RepID=A0A9W8JYY7_9AGAR|nr:hypothetical protein NLJ89_g6540 [Agrocybe chaxingu]
MSLRRGGTPLLGAGPPSLEASNQAQIDDLVQRNRTLEHLNQKLTAQINAEAGRSKEAVLAIQKQWDENQRLWKEGCEELLVSYRIVQKRLEVDLEKERSAVIKEMAVAREEKLQRLQRDFKIKLFQMKEEETDLRMEELEEEKARMEEEYELVVQKMKDKCADYAIKLKDTQAALSRSEKEREEKEAKHNKLLEKHANLEGQLATSGPTLERTKLQLEGAQHKATELERTVDELKRTNADLTRQLERWQSLDLKEGAATESQRKQRLALEAENAELKEELERKEAQLDKSERRVEKMKTTTHNWEAECKAQQQAAKTSEKQVVKLEKQIQKLKSDLEIERARVRPPSPQKPQPPPPADADVIDVDAEQQDEPPRKQAVKPESKPSATVKPGLSTQTKTRRSGIEGQVARKKTGGKPPQPSRGRKVASAPAPKSDSDSEMEEISEFEVPDEPPEEDAATRKKRKGKAKAAEDDAEEEPPGSPAQKRNGKRKAEKEDTGGDEPEVVEQPNPKKRGSRAPSVIKETAPAPTNRRSKPPSRAPSKQPTAKAPTEQADANDDDDDETAPKKKKRKLVSLFPDKSAGLLQFAAFGNGSLDIPSVLSPLKPDERVPQRSTSSSLVASLGGLMKIPFGQSRR